MCVIDIDQGLATVKKSGRCLRDHTVWQRSAAIEEKLRQVLLRSRSRYLSFVALSYLFCDIS